MQLPPEEKRLVYTYDVPPSCQVELEGFGKVLTVGLVLLTAEEEILAAKRSHNSNYRTAHELSKACLYLINNTRVSMASNADEVWSNIPPKLRTLIVTAYADLHNPNEEETAGFMVSRVAKL